MLPFISQRMHRSHGGYLSGAVCSIGLCIAALAIGECFGFALPSDFVALLATNLCKKHAAFVRIMDAAR